MEHEIRYCTASDGVRIAYATVGEGPPLLVVPAFFEQFSILHQAPAWERFYERLGEGRLLVLYDVRGTGLSERKVEETSLDSHVSDIEAVVAAAGLTKFSIYASTVFGPIAITYAARHLLQVGRLILYGTYSRGGAVMPREQLNTLTELSRNDWNLAAQVFADMSTRQQLPEEGVHLAEVFRASTDGTIVVRTLEAADDWDVSDLLPRITVPTLVIHRRGDAIIPSALGHEIAASLPDARLVALEGDVHGEYLGDTDAVLGPIDSFLREDGAPSADGFSPAPGNVVTILFTDMEGSTTLTQRLGDAKAQELLHTHNTIVRDSLEAHDGLEIKHTGDGIMASFGSARRALESAIIIQRAFAKHNAGNPHAPVHVRLGLNAGEPVAEDDDLFGTAVQLAARACANAEPGQIVIPDGLRHLVAGKDFLFADLGVSTLKGFEDPVRLFEVRWQE